MKRIISTSILTAAVILAGTAFVNAQTKSSWIPTKGVQKVANKDLYSSDEVKSSHIEATSAAIPAQVVSKQVQRVSNPEVIAESAPIVAEGDRDNQGEVQGLNSREGQAGNVTSKGYPTWSISKPLHKGK